jgi:methionyl-tRNA formyltransferase
MDAGLDTGPMLLKRAVPVTPQTTAGRLHDALAALGADLIRVALEMLARGALMPEPQDEAYATYAPKITAADGRLDWTQPAEALERRVRAMAPWPGAWFEHAGTRYKVGAAELAGGAGEPGVVLDDALTVACGSGALRLLELQRPGRAMLPADEFLRGVKLPRGTQL